MKIIPRNHRVIIHRIPDSIIMEGIITPITIMELIREMTGRMAVSTTATAVRARKTAVTATAMAADTAMEATAVTATAAVRPEKIGHQQDGLRRMCRYRRIF